MAGVSDKALVQISGWPGGVNNRSPETLVVPVSDENRRAELRAAYDVDLDDAGKPHLAPGHTLVVEALDAKGLWGCDWPFGLFVADGELTALFEDETTQVLATGLGDDRPTFALAGDDIFWSDGQRIGRVTQGLEVLPVGCEQPDGQPNVAASTSGGLPPGTYQAAITFQDARGQESGASLAIEVTLPNGGGLQLTAIPQPSIGSTINLFLTRPDGEELYWRASIPAGVTQWLLGVGPEGRRLETQFLDPFPPCHLLAYWQGHLLGARGDVLYHSQPQRYGLTRLADSWVQFSNTITAVLPVEGGVFVSVLGKPDGGGGFLDGRTYYAGGNDPRQWQRVIVHAAHAVPGTGLIVPGEVFGAEYPPEVAYWLASDGTFCIGLPGGKVVFPSKDRFIGDPATAGASVLRDINGITSILTTADRAAVSKAKFSDSITTFLIRNGVEIP